MLGMSGGDGELLRRESQRRRGFFWTLLFLRGGWEFGCCGGGGVGCRLCGRGVRGWEVVLVGEPPAEPGADVE